MRVVHDAVADRIGDRLVADERMPVLRLELAGDDRRAHRVPVLQKLPEVLPFLISQGAAPEIVDDQEVELRHTLKHATVRAIRLRLVEIPEEHWDPSV